VPRLRWLRIAAFVALSGCGESEPEPSDGGPADAGPDAADDAQAPLEPVAPAPPVLPVMTPCPDGWREVADGATAPGLVRCDPWPAGGHADCPPDQAHFPGTPGCEVVGTPCSPDDLFATDLPDNEEVIYVQAGRAGGSGLRDNPFGSLQHAINVANARGGAIVALSKGTFDGAFTIYEPVTLWGACTAETIVTRTETVELGATVEIHDRGPVTIRNLRIEADQAGIYVWEAVDPVIVDAVMIRGRNSGIYVELDATVDITNVVVRDTQPGEDARAGHGLFVLDGAHVSVTRGLFQGNHLAGTSVVGEGSELVLRDTALLDTSPEDASGLGGAGLQVRLGAQGTIERVVVERAHSGGVVALDPDSALDATDLVVRDVEPANGVGGHGVVSWDGARLTGRRIDVARTGQVGITIVDASGELDDVIVTDTHRLGLPQEQADGVGLGVGGSTATVRRALLARNVDSAIGVVSEGAHLVAEDLTVLDTTAGGGSTGYALSVAPAAEADVTRLVAARSSGGGLSVFGTLRLADALVEQTQSIGIFPFDGWGVSAVLGGSIEAERLIVRANRTVGLSAWQGAQVVGRDVQVLDTSSGAGVSSGVLVVGEGSRVELRVFQVARTEACGVQLGEGAALDLIDGEIRDNPIGANVQDPAFDLARIQEGVRYLDNGVNLDTSSLPLPTFEVAQ